MILVDNSYIGHRISSARKTAKVRRNDAARMLRITPRRGAESLFSLVIAREQRDRGDPVNNKVARIRVRALLTGLLRCTRNDKRVRATRAHPRALFLPLCITIKNRPNGRFFIYADPVF